MVYYIQIDWLGHKISTQKSIVQSDHPCPRYKTKREGLVWRKPNHNVFLLLPEFLFILFRSPCKNLNSYDNPFWERKRKNAIYSVGP